MINKTRVVSADFEAIEGKAVGVRSRSKEYLRKYFELTRKYSELGWAAFISVEQKYYYVTELVLHDNSFKVEVVTGYFRIQSKKF